MFAPATGSRVCGVSERDSRDRLVSRWSERHHLLPSSAFGPSTFAALAALLSTRASSGLCFSGQLQNSARTEALKHVDEPLSPFSPPAADLDQCVTVYVRFYGVCNATEVEHWPHFLLAGTSFLSL